MGKVILWAFVVYVAIILICALPTMLLWNWLMPTIFGLTEITFWQALGINLFCTILFKPSVSSNKND